MTIKDLEQEKLIRYIDNLEENCGLILNVIYKLITSEDVKTHDPVDAIAMLLTLVIKNVERNLIDQDFDTSFDEILHEIKTCDLTLKDDAENKVGLFLKKKGENEVI
ncbi:MAG: hypothetical protein QXF82_07905 [Nitrososphaeria archaeon]